MSRKHPWDFKNRREQHKYLVDLEQCCKFSFRHIPNITKHSKKRWREVENYHNREWALKQQDNKWIV